MTEVTEPASNGLRLDPKHMLAIFNKQDLQGNGVITGDQAHQVLSSLSLPSNSLPLDKLYTFDDLLSLASIVQTPERPSSYVTAFLTLLTSYQLKSQSAQQFEEARRTEARIVEIREREFKRRQHQVRHRQKQEWDRIEKIQQNQMKQFTDAWNQHINQFEKESFGMLEQMKDRHLDEIQREENLLRNQVKSSPKYSKKVLELKAKEKSLIKNKNYQEVIKIRKHANELANRQGRIFSEAQVQSIDKKLRELRKHQNQAMLALRDKIYNEKLALLARRKDDTECLVVRIRNLRNDVKKKMAEEEKKMSEQIREELGLGKRK